MGSVNRASGSRQRWPILSEVLAYFGLSYAFAWLFHLAIIVFSVPLDSDAGSTGQLLYALGIAGPLAGALGVTGISRGRAGVRDLMRTAFRWRFRWTWYALAVCTVGAIYGLSLGLYSLAGGDLPIPLIHLSFRELLPAVLGQVYVVIGEEYGWRGFALPRLYGLYGSLGASLILGAVWACWHLPMFFVPGSNQYGTSFLRYSASTMSWTIVMTLMYFRTGGSILAVMIFHASSNLWFFILNFPKPAMGFSFGLTTLAGLIGLTKLPRPFLGFSGGKAPART